MNQGTARAALRGSDVREALKGEEAIAREPFVFVCAWCPDSYERTKALQARGRQASHGVCAVCTERLLNEMEADQWRRV